MKTKTIIIIILVLSALGWIILLSSNDQPVKTTETQEKEYNLEIPKYEVLDKIELSVNTEKGNYSGDILIQENVMNVPPKELKAIAEQITKKEGLDYSTSFYSTRNAYKSNVGLFIPEERKELIGEDIYNEYDENITFFPTKEINKMLSKGFLGTLKDEEFKLYPTSDYYKNHLGDSNKEEDRIIK